jgi:hypothetical protein
MEDLMPDTGSPAKENVARDIPDMRELPEYWKEWYGTMLAAQAGG